jgi:hypothetical protein
LQQLKEQIGEYTFNDILKEFNEDFIKKTLLFKQGAV